MSLYLDNLVEGLRTRRSKSCEGKIAHGSEGAALRALRDVARRGQLKKDKIAGAYRCAYCGYWHWGHRPKESK